MSPGPEGLKQTEKASYLNQFGGLNAGYVADLIERYFQDPSAVPPEDRQLLHSVDVALGRAAYEPGAQATAGVDVRRLSRLLSYIAAIRDYGYRVADIDPLGLTPRSDLLLDPATHGITEEDQTFSADQAAAISGGTSGLKFGATAGELTAALKVAYCGTTGYEFLHLRSTEERAWLRYAVESGQYRPFLTSEQKSRLLELLTRAEVLEQFLHKAFPGQRWFSLEGCEALVVLIDQVVLQAAYSRIRDIVVGMAHRGRLNLLTHIFGKPYESVLREFMHGHYEHEGGLHADRGWMTDVKYHMGGRTVRHVDGGTFADITLTLMPNPSHLELVDPVVVGGARALQDLATDATPEYAAMGLLIHGDAAFAGQGIVAETLNLAGLTSYRTGGTVHVIANNQLGFTTDPHDTFSTEHASDLARGFDVPVAHVNADDIDACVAVAKLAVAYRQKFHRDFLIDLVGYRRFGHNETDDPTYTQPLMYKAIEQHPTARAIWAQKLVNAGDVQAGEPEKMVQRLFDELQALKDATSKQPANGSDGAANGAEEPPLVTVKSSLPEAELRDLNDRLSSAPAGFTPHPRMARLLERRREVFQNGKGIEWAHAESLALGAILRGGVAVRLTGQDTERGTFSQRHAVLHDYETGAPYTPLASLGGGRLTLCNSPLSEQAALAFEYGYSVMAGGSLVLWEAQFGDFINNAQSVVDELIVSGRAKWGQRSGLVLLLPHGYEGQGANHSYAHLHRFLALAADDNIRVTYPTTAAQYFHLLRLQASELGSNPSPLVVMTPKSLLRHPLATSSVKELTDGSFIPVLTDISNGGRPSAVRRLIICTGKVYSDLVSSDEYGKSKGVAVVRVEQLYPFPEDELAGAISKFRALENIVWLQEEPENRGAGLYMAPWLMGRLVKDLPVEFVGRPSLPSPAEGAHWMHSIHQAEILRRALGVGEKAAAAKASDAA